MRFARARFAARLSLRLAYACVLVCCTLHAACIEEREEKRIMRLGDIAKQLGCEVDGEASMEITRRGGD